MRVAVVVEGDGEVGAVPILLRRLAEWRTPGVWPVMDRPIRCPRDRLVNRAGEFEKYLKLAAAKALAGGWVLVLLDADDDCPAELANALLDRAGEMQLTSRVSIVIANREFEAWFSAAAASLDGRRGFRSPPGTQIDAEQPRDAKGWIREHTTDNHYDPVIHQAAYTAAFDLGAAHAGSRSFRKLCQEWDRAVAAWQDCSPADQSP